MEDNYLLPRKKDRRGRRREACIFVSFLPCRKAFYIVAWWRKKKSNSIKPDGDQATIEPKDDEEIKEVKKVTKEVKDI